VAASSEGVPLAVAVLAAAGSLGPVILEAHFRARKSSSWLSGTSGGVRR